MVKNSGVNQPTDMVRLGRYVDSEQPRNSIVFNASENKIRDIKHSGLYISPIRNASASNLLAYDSITKEVVDIGGTKLKLDELQVKNLDVLNLTTLNEEHVYTPVLEIGEGCKPTENVGVDIHGIQLMHTKSDGCLSINANTKIDGSIEATQFVGDGGLLSNVQYDLNVDIGEVVENLQILGELKADGGLLSNITVSQIEDFDGYSPCFTSINITKDINTGRSVYVNNRIHVKGNINSDAKINAISFHGDGTTLNGVAKITDIDATNVRVSKLESNIPRFEPIEKEIPFLQKQIDQLRVELPRIDTLEKNTSTHENVLSVLDPRISKLETNIPRITTCEKRINSIEASIHNLPEIERLSKDVSVIQTSIPIIHDTKKIVPRVHENTSRIIDLEKTILRFNELQQIKQQLLQFKHVYKELHRIEPLEILVSKTKSILEQTVEDIKDLPGMRERITAIENAPLEGDGSLISNISFTHVLSCSNETNLPLKIHNDVTASRFITCSAPKLTSRIGEADGICLSNLAEINGYVKANNGTTSGNPGGIAFKTRDTSGDMKVNMTLDANGKLAVGTHKGHPSAVLTLQSTTGGLLLPRMSRSEIENIKQPTPGLIVYDNENDTLHVYKKSGWTEIK
jgi:hypothetical protein